MHLQITHVTRGMRQRLVRFSQILRNVRQRFPTPSNTHQIGMFAGSLLAYESWAEPRIPH